LQTKLVIKQNAQCKDGGKKQNRVDGLYIELPAKLLDDFLRSNKSNIYQITLAVHFNKPSSTAAPCLSATKLICSNVRSGAAAALSASMMLLCCPLAFSSFTPRNLYFCPDDVLFRDRPVGPHE